MQTFLFLFFGLDFFVGIIFIDILLSLAFCLLLELYHYFIKLFLSLLVSSSELATHINVVRLFFFLLFRFIFCRVQHILFICKFQMWTFKVTRTRFRLAVGYRYIKACIWFYHSLYFFCHFCNHYVSVITTKQGINC